jgi:hypothetical protein
MPARVEEREDGPGGRGSSIFRPLHLSTPIGPLTRKYPIQNMTQIRHLFSLYWMAVGREHRQVGNLALHKMVVVFGIFHQHVIIKSGILLHPSERSALPSFFPSTLLHHPHPKKGGG